MNQSPAKTRTNMPVRVAFVSHGIWLELLRDGTVRIAVYGDFLSMGIRKPVDMDTLADAMRRLEGQSQ